MASQKPLDRLSAVDASFLAQEGPNRHMHIGGLALFDGTPPVWEELLEHVRARLHLVPRYRQKLAIPPLETGRPVWVDDPNFNLEYHIRHAALPPPGDRDRLLALAGRVFSQQLDRTKPLWELWLVEGLESERFALLSKVHHALVDGVSGIDLTSVLFDLDPEPRRPRPEGDGWQPGPEPSGLALAATGLLGAARAGAGLAAGVVSLAGRPGQLLSRARDTAEALGEVVRAGLSPAPPSPLNVTPGPHRRLKVAEAELADFKKVKDVFGGTVNDVVLAVVAGGLARFLHTRGRRTEGVELKACVPVSVRPHGQRGALGNQLTQIIAPLPLGEADPVARLRRVSSAMRGVKDSRQAVGAEAIASMQAFAPPTILAQASRLNFANRFYNLLVTNVPGPQFPVYLLGRELRLVFPVAFLAGDRALAVAVMSYNGRMAFGLIGDYDALPDLSTIAGGIEDALAELVAAAARSARRDGGSKRAGARRRGGPRAAGRPRPN